MGPGPGGEQLVTCPFNNAFVTWNQLLLLDGAQLAVLIRVHVNKPLVSSPWTLNVDEGSAIEFDN